MNRFLTITTRFFFATGILGMLSACDTPPAPVAEPNVAPAEEVSTRSITFSGEWAPSDVAVAAQCTLRGSEFEASFVTPAKVQIPVDDSGRAILNKVRCVYEGASVEWETVPGPSTRYVTARFGGTGFLGKNSLLFGEYGNQVQYFATEGRLITVGRAPTP